MKKFIQIALMLHFGMCLFTVSFCKESASEKESPDSEKKDREEQEEQKKFREDLTDTVKKIKTVYSNTLKELKKANHWEKTEKVLAIHISEVKPYYSEMLLLEIHNPELFERQTADPPRESKELRKLTERLALAMAERTSKYSSQPKFLKMQQQLMAGLKNDPLILETVDQIFAKRQNIYQNILQEIKTENDMAILNDKLEIFLQSLIKEQKKINLVGKRYPDLLKRQKKSADNRLIKTRKLHVEFIKTLKNSASFSQQFQGLIPKFEAIHADL